MEGSKALRVTVQVQDIPSGRSSSKTIEVPEEFLEGVGRYKWYAGVLFGQALKELNDAAQLSYPHE